MKKIIKPMCVVLAGLISITWVNLAHSEEPEPFILRIPDSEIRKSLNNIHHEICECLAFFIAGTAKVKEQGATESDLAALNNAAIELAELARLLHQDKVTTARIGLASDQMMNEMDYDYANFSLLLQKYQPACVRLHSDVYEEVFRLLVAAQEEGLLQVLGIRWQLIPPPDLSFQLAGADKKFLAKARGPASMALGDLSPPVSGPREKIVDRRQFLIRTAAASGQLILPPFFDRALAFVENHGEALIEAPPEPVKTLYAAYREEGVYWIIDGLMPRGIPPPVNWREYFLLTGDDLVRGIENWELEPSQLDEPMNHWAWETYWLYNSSPNALAYKYLQDLDLGPEFGKSDRAEGEIRFQDAPMMASDCRWAEVDDLLSISLLQNRLNELGENVSLEVGGEFN